MVRLDELFEIYNGYPSSNVVFNEGTLIRYIRPSNKYENTLAGYINKDIVPLKYVFPSNTLFVSTDGDGSHTYSYVSSFDFVPNSNVSVLIPKIDMTLREKHYYALCITSNRYRFSYGRKPKGNRLAEIKVPSKEEIPQWVYDMELPKYEVINGKHTDEPTPSLDVEKWGSFKYSDLFDISIGKSTDLNKLEQVEDGVNYVGRTDVNNGVTAKVKVDNSIEVYKGSCLTVPMVGNVMKSTYQNSEFTTSQNILILRLKEDKSAFVYLFISTLIHREQYRFNYGRSLSFDRLDGLKLKLPITKEGTPDWDFMEKYIKTLKYSKEL